MPVLLTRPASAVARATASLLLDDGAQVRLFGTGAPGELRARGAFVADGTPDDHGLLEAALAQVHTMIHVGPGLTVDDADHLVVEARLALDAAERAGVQRVVVLSLPGADPHSDDPLRAAAGLVEADAESRPYPTVAVRCSLVDTPATRDLLAIDEARSRATSGHVVFDAIGPEPLTLDAYLRQVGVRGEDGSTDLVGRVYRPGGADAPGRRAISGPWVPSDDSVAADLWSFAEHTPRPVTP